MVVGSPPGTAGALARSNQQSRFQEPPSNALSWRAPIPIRAQPLATARSASTHPGWNTTTDKAVTAWIGSRLM